MGLAFGGGVGNQGVIVELLGFAEYGAGDIDRIVKGKLVDDVDRGIVEVGQPFCKLRAGGDFNFIGQTPNDLAKGPYLIVAIAAGY